AVEPGALPAIAARGLEDGAALLLSVDCPLDACHFRNSSCETGPGRAGRSPTRAGAPQRPSNFLIRRRSALLTSTTPVIRRVTCEDLPSSRCRLPTCSATTLPPPVTRTRFPM